MAEKIERENREICWDCKHVKLGGFSFPAGCFKLNKENLNEKELEGCSFFEFKQERKDIDNQT
ncbi:MAG: hypothetical protein QXK49_03680 [Candidatus Aenigmatarchaeota archaeon]